MDPVKVRDYLLSPEHPVGHPEGRYLGRVELDLDVHPTPRVDGGRIVGVRRDELEVPFVIVYRLEGRRSGR